MLPQIDDRAIGLIGNSLQYAAGHRHAGEQGVRRRLRQEVQAAAVVVRRVGLHGEPVDQDGDRQDQAAMSRTATRSSRRCAPSTDQGAARTAQARRLRQPDPERLRPRIQKIKHPVLGEVLINVPIKTYEAVSQFWTWTPEEFLKRGPLQALSHAHDHRRRRAALPSARRRHFAAPSPDPSMPSAILQAINGISLRRAAVPARERLHAHVRPDARRQHGARRLLSARRLYRPLDHALHRQLRARRTRRRARDRPARLSDRPLPDPPHGENHLAQVLLTVGVAFVHRRRCAEDLGRRQSQGADADRTCAARSSCLAASSIRPTASC